MLEGIFFVPFACGAERCHRNFRGVLRYLDMEERVRNALKSESKRLFQRGMAKAENLRWLMEIASSREDLGPMFGEEYCICYH